MSRAKRKRIAALHRKQRRRLGRLGRDILFSPLGMAAVAAFAFNKAQEFTPERGKERQQRKPYEAPAILRIEPGPLNADLLAAFERAGMRRLNCEACGCDMLTRGTSNKCPPCRGGEA
jgi:hypothetical protein